MASSMDLPHVPRKAEELYEGTLQLTNQFSSDIQRKTLAPKMHLKVRPRKYGAKVRICFFSPQFCHCEEVKCKDGEYILQDSIMRVKGDLDLVHLECFLKKQFDIWREKVCYLKNDDSETD